MGLRSCSRSQTLSPNSAPQSIPLPTGTPPAPVEKPASTHRRVTLRAEIRLCSSSPPPAAVTPAPLSSWGSRALRARGSDAKQQGSGHQRERRELHPGWAAPGSCAGHLQTGQVPVRPQGARTQKKGIFLRSLLHRWTLLFFVDSGEAALGEEAALSLSLFDPPFLERARK